MNTRELRFRSNRVCDIQALYRAELRGLYPDGEVESIMRMLFEAFLGWDGVRYMLSRQATVDQSDLLRLHWALEDLKRYRPVQHIVGSVEFCGCRIGVGPEVLVPRPETEEIVNWTVTEGRRQWVDGAGVRMLDLCTGSGCVAIALARAFAEAEVWAVDLSAEALARARSNAEACGVRVRAVQADVLQPLGERVGGEFDLMVSNPPYVCESERGQMSANVLDYEPQMALFVPDDDPLRFYAAICRTAAEWLSADGLVVFEINERMAEGVCRLLREAGFDPVVADDFRGRPRRVSARRAGQYKMT